MNQQQRQYYEAMRRSQEASMRRSHEPQQNTAMQRASAPTNPYSNPYTNSSRDSRDSRGSRGSSEGLRMSSGTEMAGVGIFFQQEPQTGKVYVANIVPGGSADRSGVIRINDVIVKVDDEDVQGQPLSTLRNLILGKQGSYVVLAFRRMTGTELYYFDVELVRGTPEYFESLKKNQAIQDEKEKLLMQVRQQEAEIHQLKQTHNAIRTSGTGAIHHQMEAPSASPPPPGDHVRELEQRKAMIAQMERELKALQDDKGAVGAVGHDAAGVSASIRTENMRLADTVAAAQASVNELVKRLDVDRAGWDSERKSLEGQVADAQRSKVSSTGALASLQQENQRLKSEAASRKAREDELQRKLREVAQGLEAGVKISDENARTLQELIPALDSLHSQVFASFGYDPSRTAAVR